MTATAPGRSVVGSGPERLDRGWQAAATSPGAVDDPAAIDGLAWLPARVPGTAAGARRDAGLPFGDPDGEDWWYRVAFDAPAAAADEEVVLLFGGLATIADAWLNGEHVLASRSMFEEHSVDVGRLLRGRNELVVRFAAIAPLLETPRKPRARWRTRLVADNNLRWIRTTLIGRIPGFASGPAPAGPWRPVELERRRGLVVDEAALRTRIEGDDGVLAVRVRLHRTDGATLPDSITMTVAGAAGNGEATITRSPDADDRAAVFAGEVRITGVTHWWPHTHGTAALSSVRLDVEAGADEPGTVDLGRVGFRSIAPGPRPDHDVDRDGLFVHVNGVPVFARGALWTPLDAVDLGATRAELRAALETVRAAGMNMVRLPGFGTYEQDAFHELCDELGILVWQELMFASMDYPFVEETFGQVAADEVRRIADRTAGHPSTAVLCGNSEVQQQVAMLGLDLAMVRIPFYDEIAPAIARDAGLDAVYVPGTPSGGPLPIRPDRGVTNYYGVGGYRYELSDARTSGLRFAGECLAFANVPDEDVLSTLVPEPPHDPFVHHPRWKQGVARDSGSGWDFDDLRDFYLEKVFGIDPGWLRRGNHDRYLELSRAVSGEVMAHVYGEWRREESPSGGGLILWLRDLVPGAGWGVVDHRGRPKTAWHHLRRILAPTAVWLVDEGIGGVVAHVANDGPEPLAARLRFSLFTDLELPVGGTEVAIDLPPHGAIHHDIEAALGRFVDIAWAYRFGPPAQDVVVASLERDGPDGPELLSQAFHYPAGRPLHEETEARLGLAASVAAGADGRVRLTVSSRRLAYGVRIHVPGFAPSDDAFSVEPGGSRRIELVPDDPGGAFPGGSLTAINLRGRVPIRNAEASS
ncbi:MAG TPA: hypothetical protein VID95_11335 [Candidatus Limnocylindrales bacterium]